MDCPASPGIRRRNVDIHRPLPVVWIKEEDAEKQVEALHRVLSTNGSHKPITTQIRKQNQQLMNQQTQNISLKTSMGHVDTPSIRTVENPIGFEDPPYTRPVSYIHYHDPPYDFDARNYQLEDEDYDFLSLWNATIRTEISLHITEDRFEDIITLLENLTYQNHRAPVHQDSKQYARQLDFALLANFLEKAKFTKFDTLKRILGLKEMFMDLQGLQCQACSCDGKENRETLRHYLRCSSCDIVTHKTCYYGDGTPIYHRTSHFPRPLDVDWECDPCVAEFATEDSSEETIPPPRVCALCLQKDGLLRKTVDQDRVFGAYVHIICAKWLPKDLVSFLPDGRVDGIRNIYPEQWNLKCKGCNEKGVAIQCSASHCRHFYHPFCAQRKNCFIDDKERILYCAKHTQKANESKEHLVDSHSSLSVELLEKLAPIVQEKAREALNLSRMAHSVVFEIIFYYWKCKRLKRKSFLINQLSVMLQEEQDVLDQPKRGKHRVDEGESLQRIVGLRKDLEYARILLDMVRTASSTPGRLLAPLSDEEIEKSHMIIQKEKQPEEIEATQAELDELDSLKLSSSEEEQSEMEYEYVSLGKRSTGKKSIPATKKKKL